MKWILASLFIFNIFAQVAPPNFKKKIGVLLWSNTIEGQVAMKLGLQKKFKEEIKKRKIDKPKYTYEITEYIAGDGEAGIENQIKQFHQLIDEKVDLIIVQPTNNAALVQALKRANKVKIPVITFDQYILEGTITSFITSDNYQAGYLNGEYVASHFENVNKLLKIILVEYPIVSSTVERVNGFMDALNEHKIKFKIIKSYNAVEPASGLIAAKNILDDFPLRGSVDIIFAINDGGGLVIAKELIKHGRDDIIMATIDGDPQSVSLVKKNTILKIDSAQFCSVIGEKSMEIAFDVLDGKKVAKKVLVPTYPITIDTVKFYNGWQGEIPNGFEKPWKEKSFWNNNFKYIE